MAGVKYFSQNSHNVLFFLEQKKGMFRSSVTVVNADTKTVSFPEGQIKEKCDLDKFFQYIKFIEAPTEVVPLYELVDSLSLYSQDSNNPNTLNRLLKTFSFASTTSFSKGAGNDFVHMLL